MIKKTTPIASGDEDVANSALALENQRLRNKLRELVNAVDEMRVNGEDYIDPENDDDGPDHWFGEFSNFNSDYEQSGAAVSWPNLSLVAKEAAQLLDTPVIVRAKAPRP